MLVERSPMGLIRLMVCFSRGFESDPGLGLGKCGPAQFLEFLFGLVEGFPGIVQSRVGLGGMGL
jgi:hypothetical protein